jgi:predicted ferric reductase
MVATTPITNRIAALVALLCTSWSLLYVLLGATPAGHDWYGTVAKSWFFADPKGGVPVLVLAVPLLVMASTCSLLVAAKPHPNQVRGAGGGCSASYTYVYGPNRCLCLLALPCIIGRRLRQRVARMGFDALSALFLLLPCAVYFVAAIYRHLYAHDGELDMDKKVMEIANAGGMVAMVMLSWFLIPVARHTALLTLMGWSPEKAIRMHIWAGRIGIVGVTWHGLGHMYRWYVRNDGVVSMLFPKAECWTYFNDGTCYDLFRNFTGLIAMVFMVAIALASLSFVRRASYGLFYKVHVIAGPTSLVFAILHWNRMVLFLCPSILYYVASTVPVLVRLFRSYVSENGVKLVYAIDLSCLNTTTSDGTMRSCLSITFEVDGEAARQYRPGQYVKLSVPSISGISHPFTVNPVLSRSKPANQMRIIFRATGPFTRGLSKSVLDPAATASRESTALAPLMVMDGFYGQSNLVEKVFGYDVAVIVAGGVGITPYLSLVSEFCSLGGTEASADESSIGKIQSPQSIELHWMCRDSALIDYVKNEYFVPLAAEGSGKGLSRSIRIVIHFTGREQSSSNGTDAVTPDYSGTADTPNIPAPQSREGRTVKLGSGGLPFSPTRFSVGTSSSIFGNLPLFLTSSTISWLGLVSIWFTYANCTSKNEIISRSYGVLALMPISLIVGLLSNIVLDKLDADNSLTSWNFRRRRRRHSYIGLGGENKGGSGDEFEDEEFTRANDESGLSLHNMSSFNHGADVEKSNGDYNGNEVSSSFPEVQEGLQGEEAGNSEILLEEKSGRPSMDSILACLDSANNPGIFVCGPKKLVEDVKSVAKLRYSMRFRQFLDVSSPEIHEETFEL